MKKFSVSEVELFDDLTADLTVANSNGHSRPMNSEEKIQYLVDVRDFLRDGGGEKLAEYIDEWLQKYAPEHGMCPICGEELEIEEHGGVPYGAVVTELVQVAVCPNGCI